MSRSLHTQPYALRSARRAESQYRRRADEPSVSGRPVSPSGRPRIGVAEQPARPGFVHPAGARDVAEFLADLDPGVAYGVRSVELRHAVGGGGAGRAYGECRPPGLIILYEQPRDAGVTRYFMLWHVLAHELGHHVLQMRSGRPRISARRRVDHETFAELFAAGLRLAEDGATR